MNVSKRQRWEVIGWFVALVFLCAAVSWGQTPQPTPAQAKPAQANAGPEKADDKTPQVPADAKQTLGMLQRRLTSIGDCQAILQKEADAALAELNRTIQRLQVSGWKLDGSLGLENLRYLKDEPAATSGAAAPPAGNPDPSKPPQ